MKRQGNTGIWTLVMDLGEKVLATSEWGTNYEFNKKEWEQLSIISSESVGT